MEIVTQSWLRDAKEYKHMKIGIMTINSAYNYGCVLQAWSLQRYLEKEGHEAFIINYRIPEIANVYLLFQ